MANPQKEQGYTPIANEILDQIVAAKLTLYELRILIFIMRKTYGYQKKQDWISKGQFAKATGIKRTNVIRTINGLMEKNIVTKTGSPHKPQYGIQKDWEKWELGSPSTDTSLSRDTSLSTETGVVSNLSKKGSKLVSTEIPTKESITKETLQKKIASTARRSKKETEKTPEEKKMDEDIIAVFERFQMTINPTINYGHKTNRKAAEWMIKQWGLERTLKLVDYAIHIHGEPFAPTVTTPYQLKEKYAQVSSHYLKNQKQAQKNSIAVISDD